jgi:hypothetical protein
MKTGELENWQLIKRGRTWFSPDVWRVSQGQEQLILKDYRTRPLLGRFWGRWVIAREQAVLRKLQGIAGVPQWRGTVGPYGFLMTELSGEPLPRRGLRARTGPEFFDACRRLLEAIHARGIAHGDIRRKNFLLTPEGTPALIDYQTAWLDGKGWLRHRIFVFLAKVDHWNLVRMKMKSFPHALTNEESELLAHPPLLLQLGRFMRQKVYARLFPKRHQNHSETD